MENKNKGCANGNQNGSKFAHITKVHPCFNEKLHDKVGRAHVPIAPKCNIGCNFCIRSINTDENSEGISNTKIEDYNIIVLSSGANDYNDNAELGDINSSDVSTFNGALNNILTKIEQASNNRIEKGEEPIKVIFANFYSVFSSKYKKPNRIGLTFYDYEKEIDKLYEKWETQSDSLTFYKCDTRDYGIINKDNYSYATSYSAHFTKFTYGQYGNAFAQFLVDNVFENTIV